MALSDAGRIRLAKLLGMLDSNAIGERANAGALADRLIRDRGMTWDQVIAAVPANAHGHHHQQEPRRRRGAARTWRDCLNDCRSRAPLLTEWERRFLESLASWRGVPTNKQQLKLRAIAERLGVELWA